MRCSYTTLVLATLTIGQVVAHPLKYLLHGHANFHAKKAAELLQVEAIVEKREPIMEPLNITARAEDETLVARATSLTSSDQSKLTSMGALIGVNAVSNNGAVWIGTGGAYTNTFSNGAGKELILVVWGPGASWVNVHTPLVTASLAAGASITISFAYGSIGAWSAVYPDTALVNGQVSNTWGEYTFSSTGVFDVTREVNMNGHGMSIVGPKCTANMSTCVFVCSSGTVCTTGYELLNCASGSQPGAQYGTYDGAPSGGCGGLGSSSSISTTFF